MPEKTNQDRIKEYLVGEKGYLKSNLSDGKVIMLSGKWGCGKTHFWQNEIATDNLKKELNEKNSAYSYISLYGKSSIEEIENDIFGQIYFSAIGGENVATKTFSTFTKYSKRYGNIFSSFDFSKLAVSLKEEDKENKERVSLERLKNSAIICFDDFERKSKDIDLNDLFGFITQLTINFKCKVVIILNDDVFEGEEKNVFSRVKEKSVSKFFKYKPSIKELFTTIFENEIRYKILSEHKEIILKTIEETQELNARIYIQVLDNLVEWIENKNSTADIDLEWLILTNINFIINHKVFIKMNDDTMIIKGEEKLNSNIKNIMKGFPSYLNKNLINQILSNLDENEYSEKNITFIQEHKGLIRSYNFLKLRYGQYYKIKSNMILKINNFIETGILIDE